MTDFNWCHGPKCHTKHTVDRVRGVKGSKVLRTRKVKVYESNYWYNYFCSQNCYDNFANEYINQIVAIAPRTECLETPIEVEVVTTIGAIYTIGDKTQQEGTILEEIDPDVYAPYAFYYELEPE